MMMMVKMMKTTDTVLSCSPSQIFTSLPFPLPTFLEQPEGNQTTNKREDKETAYIDPLAF